MTRARIMVLGLFAALLMSHGGGVALRPADRPEASPTSTAVDAVTIAGHLAFLNPQLSEQQQARIASAVLRSSARHGLDPDLVVAVIAAESGARPWVRSHKGAVGLMQVMPHMHREMSLAGGLATIETNVDAGCAILSDNIRRLGEDRGILAYFWGSNIRGAAYLERVEAAREAFRLQLSS